MKIVSKCFSAERSQNNSRIGIMSKTPLRGPNNAANVYGNLQRNFADGTASAQESNGTMPIRNSNTGRNSNGPERAYDTQPMINKHKPVVMINKNTPHAMHISSD